MKPRMEFFKSGCRKCSSVANHTIFGIGGHNLGNFCYDHAIEVMEEQEKEERIANENGMECRFGQMVKKEYNPPHGDQLFSDWGKEGV